MRIGRIMRRKICLLLHLAFFCYVFFGHFMVASVLKPIYRTKSANSFAVRRFCNHFSWFTWWNQDTGNCQQNQGSTNR